MIFSLLFSLPFAVSSEWPVILLVSLSTVYLDWLCFCLEWGHWNRCSRPVKFFPPFVSWTSWAAFAEERSCMGEDSAGRQATNSRMPKGVFLTSFPVVKRVDFLPSSFFLCAFFFSYDLCGSNCRHLPAGPSISSLQCTTTDYSRGTLCGGIYCTSSLPGFSSAPPVAVAVVAIMAKTFLAFSNPTVKV